MIGRTDSQPSVRLNRLMNAHAAARRPTPTTICDVYVIRRGKLHGGKRSVNYGWLRNRVILLSWVSLVRLNVWASAEPSFLSLPLRLEGGGLTVSQRARVQRGESATARCARTGITGFHSFPSLFTLVLEGALHFLD